MNEWSKEGFGMRLKRLREQRQLSMMAFGAAIGTSASRIKDWEKGKNAPSAAWIAKISERFNVSTDELIMGDIHASSAFIHSGRQNVETLYDKLKETIVADQSENDAGNMNLLYEQIDAENKCRYRSGKGRKRAELELLEIIADLPKKDVLELLELAKIKKRWI
ncbi:helix-turn-helix domain-containing protein [Sporosarcina sp. HYO08]|uniref:helix-turn-helix domain-containing protein n=1 Tax=Sporosarcina sp. HYO08 TaxID=1759557 RepID=UPI00079128B4|nr:helix-turn-helix transcriptional regulator [Sporosarcina sp. HYO08]KXH87220.1 hypothetical protein AU377_01200 [Sporosarcina sp. HYO08]